MTPTTTNGMKNNLSEAGSHLKQAAVDSGDVVLAQNAGTIVDVDAGA